MRLVSVSVRDFKSIEDSNSFSVGPVTCLVGKNESGKTALLEALEKLNPVDDERADFVWELEYPRRKIAGFGSRMHEDPASARVVSTDWELGDDDVRVFEELLGPDALTDRTLTIEKGYENVLGCRFPVDDAKVVENLLGAANLNAAELSPIRSSSTVRELGVALKGLSSPTAKQTKLLSKVDESFPNQSVNLACWGPLEAILPKFVYFPDYEKMPGKVSLNDLQTREQQGTLEMPQRIFLALLSLAGTSPNEIKEMTTHERLIAQLEGVSNRISEEIFEFWSQNQHLQVDFRFDAAQPGDSPPYNQGYVFNTRITNNRHRVSVPFDERSTGFVWFFSFLIWFSQLKETFGERLIILLDEPGLSLHGRAQQDLLRFIAERLKPTYQVIYTTHSPFMVNPSDLLESRIVEDREGEGTKVTEEVLSLDRDTILPLQAALGYDITQTLFVGRHALLVEGPSDLLYFQWASNLLNQAGRTHLDQRWTLTPTGGIDKVVSFVSLFYSQAIEIAVVADVHVGGKSSLRRIRESELLEAGRIFSLDNYVAGNEADVEDLLGACPSNPPAPGLRGCTGQVA